jgi:hypothetical protein
MTKTPHLHAKPKDLPQPTSTHPPLLRRDLSNPQNLFVYISPNTIKPPPHYISTTHPPPLQPIPHTSKPQHQNLYPSLSAKQRRPTSLTPNTSPQSTHEAFDFPAFVRLCTPPISTLGRTPRMGYSGVLYVAFLSPFGGKEGGRIGV